MEKTSLEITIISAKGLNDVGHFSKMDVYVAVSISGDPHSAQRTPVHTDGGSSPSWNYPMNFTVDESAVQMNRLNISFCLRHERTLLGDKDVGEVHVPVKELLDKAGYGNSAVKIEYPVRQFSGNANGQLKFSFKFGAGKRINAYQGHAHVGASANTVYPPPVEKVGTNIPPTAGPYPPPLGPPPLPTGCPSSVEGPYPPLGPPPGYPLSAEGPYPPQAGYPPAAAAVGGYSYPPYDGYHHQPPPVGYPPVLGCGYPPMQQRPHQPYKVDMILVENSGNDCVKTGHEYPPVHPPYKPSEEKKEKTKEKKKKKKKRSKLFKMFKSSRKDNKKASKKDDGDKQASEKDEDERKASKDENEEEESESESSSSDSDSGSD